MRSALGATRGRIAAQLLVESLVLGALGGVAGLGLAALLIEVAAPLVPGLPFTSEITLELARAGVCVAAALGVSILVGADAGDPDVDRLRRRGAEQRVARLVRRATIARAAPSSPRKSRCRWC